MSINNNYCFLNSSLGKERHRFYLERAHDVYLERTHCHMTLNDVIAKGQQQSIKNLVLLSVCPTFQQLRTLVVRDGVAGERERDSPESGGGVQGADTGVPTA